MTKHKYSVAARIRRFMRKHPDVAVPDVAKELGTTKQYIYTVLWHDKKKNTTAEAMEKAKATVREMLKMPPTPPVPEPKQAELPIDMVNQPPHYRVGGIETIDFIEAKKLNYNIGNVVKYVTRADHKGNRKQDLEKALWYLERELQSMT